MFVQASTLGSLEALLGFLKTSKIPCSKNYLITMQFACITYRFLDCVTNIDYTLRSLLHGLPRIISIVTNLHLLLLTGVIPQARLPR